MQAYYFLDFSNTCLLFHHFKNKWIKFLFIMNDWIRCNYISPQQITNNHYLNQLATICWFLGTGTARQDWTGNHVQQETTRIRKTIPPACWILAPSEGIPPLLIPTTGCPCQPIRTGRYLCGHVVTWEGFMHHASKISVLCGKRKWRRNKLKFSKYFKLEKWYSLVVWHWILWTLNFEDWFG